MMMSSSGMAGFFFALIGASVTMVRVYSGNTPHAPTPAPNKVVKVIKYVQSPTPSPTPTPVPTSPSPPPPTVIHHQPYVEEHHPTYHAPHYPPPSYGSYYPPPYWTRNYDRSGGILDGGRKRRRRIDNLHESNLNEIYVTAGENGFWVL